MSETLCPHGLVLCDDCAILEAVLAERERCAKIADDYVLPEKGLAFAAGGLFSVERNSTCAEIAARIRKGCS